MAEKDEKLLRNILGDLVYGTDEQTLAEVVGEKLAQQNKTIAVAESCTGGYFGQTIDRHARCKQIFHLRLGYIQQRRQNN